MKYASMTGAAGVIALSMAALSAQSTGTQTPQTPTAGGTTQTIQGQTGVTTLRGCVYKERDIPGRAPNVAERAGVMEDYILVPDSSDHSQMMHGTAGAAGTGTTASGTATGTTASGTMTHGGAATAGAHTMQGPHVAYKLEKIADERLRAMVGKMVEVTGRMDVSATDTAAGAAATGTATGTTATGTSGTGTTGSATGTTSGTAATPGRDRSMGPDSINLPEFEVTSMKEVQGTCPATPTLNKK